MPDVALPTWLRDLYVRDLRELAAAGDAEAEARLEALLGSVAEVSDPTFEAS